MSVRKLRCPSGHEWTIDDRKVEKLELPRCPSCNDLPGLGSEIGWEYTVLGCAGMVFLLVLPIILFSVALVLLRPHPDNLKPWSVIMSFVTLGWWVALFYYLFRSKGDVKQFARSVGLIHHDALPAGRLKWLANWPIKERISKAGLALTGRFQGTQVVLANVMLPVHWMLDPPRLGRPRRLIQLTIVAFPDPISGLPDFDIEPVADRSRFWNVDLLELLRLRSRAPLRDEPFGNHFRLENCPPETFDAWLTGPERDLLAKHGGWAIQARAGQIVIFRPRQTCPDAGIPTLLAVAWRIRSLFLRGAANREQGARPAEKARNGHESRG